MELKKLVQARYDLSAEISRLKKEYDLLGKKIVDGLTEPEQKIGKYRVSYTIEPVRYYYDKQLIVNDFGSDTYYNLSEPINDRVENFLADSPEGLKRYKEKRIPEGEKAVLRVKLWKHKPKKYNESEMMKMIEEN